MKPLRLIIDNAHDAATLTATSEALPVANTQRSGRSYVWRSNGTGQQVLTGTFDVPRYLSALLVYNHNLTSEGTLRIEYLLEGAVVFDTGPVIAADIIPLGIWQAGIDPWGAQDLTELPSVQYNVWTDSTLVSSYRLTLNDPGNPDGFLQVSRIFAGIPYSPDPDKNASFGVNLEWQEFAEHQRTESGSLRTIGEGVARRLSFDLNHLDSVGLAELGRELLKAGKQQDVYISLYPETGGMKEAEHAFIARRANNYGHTHNYVNNWQAPLVLEEV
ncbi:hypothetical protein LG331_09020 [Vreelandella aquamarina]|uniref:hypothetical protein n=1 Tax=Vreelandella aquamarina TaxID=77097 RepID=UPI00384F1003